MLRQVIVNADDLGWSRGVTDGILVAHREGIVTSATLAANMPDAARAVALTASLPSLGVGVHLNACQGRPLHAGSGELAGDDGFMSSTAVRVIARCIRRPGRITLVLAEFEAQIRWALEHGLRPTHLDSHRHVHAFPPLFAGVMQLSKRYGIPFIRRPCEKLPGGPDWPRPPRGQARTAWLLRTLCAMNMLTGRSHCPTVGTWGIAHTGLITEAWLLRAAAAIPEGTTEIMTHPGYACDLDRKETRLLTSRQMELAALCAPVVREAFSRRHLELIHYGLLRPRD